MTETTLNWAKHSSDPSVAILATGDELVQGDIADKNGPEIAHALMLEGIPPAMQMTVGDDLTAISEALSFLLSKYQVVITMGGLGPTSDDLTRFAIAQALGVTCDLDGQVWERIQARYKARQAPCPESNRQQAMMPKGMTVLPNKNGTADGGHLTVHGRTVYMLPGPPNECMPIAKAQVIPDIIERIDPMPTFRQQWLLFNMGESQVADKMKPIEEEHPDVEVGYLADFPYQLLKLARKSAPIPDELTEKIDSLFREAIISRKNEDLVEQCLDWLKGTKQKILIADRVSGGKLQAELLTPETSDVISFSDQLPDTLENWDIVLELQGGDEFWADESAPKGYAVDILEHKPDEKLTGLRLNWPARLFQKAVVGMACMYLLRLA